MNKTELGAIRKEIKTDGNFEISQLCRIYIKGDSKEIFIKESSSFRSKDEDEQELYFKNFKKMLTGNFDSKIFELDFKSEITEESSQLILNNMLTAHNANELETEALKIVNKLKDSFIYGMDVVVNFAKAKCKEPVKQKKGKKTVEDYNDESDNYTMNLVLCSVNYVDTAPKELYFDHDSKSFCPNSSTDRLMNVKTPIEGFMFPSFCNNSVDVNKIIYCHGRANERNLEFLDNVINCRYVLTAKEEKEQFDKIVQSVVGEKISSDALKEVFENVNNLSHDDDTGTGMPSTIDVKRLQSILTVAGINTDGITKAFCETVGENYDFRVANVIPNYNSKSLKIKTATVNIAIRPKDVNTIRQVVDEHGRKCILIEVGEDIEINGLKIQTEKIGS